MPRPKGVAMEYWIFNHQLQFRFPFRIAHGLRTHTAVVYLQLRLGGHTAWGEAALPPYLPETQASVGHFIQSFLQAHPHWQPEQLLAALQAEQTDMPARAALDMALHSLLAQTKPGHSLLLPLAAAPQPPSFYTISACTSQVEMQMRVQHGLQNGFTHFKLKLIDENIASMLDWFRACTAQPFAVDANQSWQSVTAAVALSHTLQQQGCLFLEQPFAKENLAASAALKRQSALPVFADESCQRIYQLPALAEAFDWVNIKLMKCGGLTEAYGMIQEARALGLKVLIGCMSESSVGCNSAAALAPLCDYADLDGPFLITNDFDATQWV
ncbi:MAG: hypothetical protein IPH78_10585 [Bacteroidetes bacterium]|nr:hypothetical protein [Bacteroidota bacterium]